MGAFDGLAALREGNMLEYKSARGGFPASFWETYSAFGNTDGGVVVLGAEEGPDGLPVPSGVDDPQKLCKALWDGLNNRKKTSANTLVDDDVTVEWVGDSAVVIVRVPRADRDLRPVFVNGDMLGGSYRRNGEGDYHCTRREVNAMVRDSYPSDIDKRVLDDMDMGALDTESVRAYRQEFRDERPEHPWVDLGNEIFLVRLGAAGRSDRDGALHPTHAGLLMFGQEWRITDEYPEYFLDCRQALGGERWDNRIVSSSGEWSGNVYDFYRKACRMLTDGLPVPFALDRNMRRIDDTPQHKAVREAMANALIHADYYDRCGIVAIRYDDRIEIRNPGGLRMPAAEVIAGGVSDVRNGTLMKMFNLIGVGEKAGSGFDVMRASTRSVGRPDPTIAERHEPDLVTLVLPLETSGVRYAQALGRAGGAGDPATQGGAGELPVEDRRSRGLGSSGTVEERLTESRKHEPKDDPNEPKDDPNEPKDDPNSLESGLGQRQLAILGLIRKNNRITYEELAEELAVSRASIGRDIALLKARGLVTRSGNTRGTWKVR